MHSANVLSDFLMVAQDDPRITTSHICVFVTLIHIWSDRDWQNPIAVKSRIIMDLAKISSTATYHKCIKDLHDFGYIKYQPSHDYFSGSLVFFNRLC